METIDYFLKKHNIVRYEKYFRALMLDYGKAVVDHCAENATVENLGSFGGDGQSCDYFEVDKKSILDLKKDLK
jgi:hypothetical protein